MAVLDTIALATNASAGNGAAQQCKGGRYVISVVAAGIDGSNTAAIQLLGPDGSTWLLLGTALTAAGTAAIDIPPGSIRVVLGAAITGAYVNATRVGYN